MPLLITFCRFLLTLYNAGPNPENKLEMEKRSKLIPVLLYIYMNCDFRMFFLQLSDKDKGNRIIFLCDFLFRI